MLRRNPKEILEAEFNNTVGLVDVAFGVIVGGNLLLSGISIKAGGGNGFMFETSLPPIFPMILFVFLIIISLVLTGYYDQNSK